MKKLLFTLSCIVLLCTTISAQVARIEIHEEPGSTSRFKRDVYLTLDTAKLRIMYRQVVIHDTVAKKPETVNTMMLQIGNNMSKYSDYNKIYGDSVIDKLYFEEGVSMTEAINKGLPFSRGTSNERIFINYPENNITIINYMVGQYYKYEEVIPKIKWKLETGSDTVCGYTCKKATCELFGRNYTAWYAPEIAINNGPWKFSGLPGLILKVVDDEEQVSFEGISITNCNWIDPITIPEKDYIKTSKDKFLKSFREYKENPGGMLKSSGMVISPLPAKAMRKRAYNPIER